MFGSSFMSLWVRTVRTHFGDGAFQLKSTKWSISHSRISKNDKDCLFGNLLPWARCANIFFSQSNGYWVIDSGNFEGAASCLSLMAIASGLNCSNPLKHMCRWTRHHVWKLMTVSFSLRLFCFCVAFRHTSPKPKVTFTAWSKPDQLKV